MEAEAGVTQLHVQEQQGWFSPLHPFLKPTAFSPDASERECSCPHLDFRPGLRRGDYFFRLSNFIIAVQGTDTAARGLTQPPHRFLKPTRLGSHSPQRCVQPRGGFETQTVDQRRLRGASTCRQVLTATLRWRWSHDHLPQQLQEATGEARSSQERQVCVRPNPGVLRRITLETADVRAPGAAETSQPSSLKSK